jgi:uncharacterized protein YuzE
MQKVVTLIDTSKIDIINRRKGEGKMDKNKIKIRYDKDGDILYILSAKGPVKDTIEIGEDVFIEIDKNGKIVGIEIWQARKNIFAELIKYLKGIRQEIKEKISV